MMTPGNVQPASEQGVRMSTEAADSKPKMERSNIRQGEAAILFMKKASPQQRRAFEASPQPGGLAAQTELSAPPALSPSLNITLPPKTEAEALPKYAAEAMTHVKDAIPQPRNTVSPMQGSTLAARSNRFAQAIVPSASAASMRAIVAGPAPAGVLWSIGTSPATTEKPRGVVERSMDSGKTWEVVPLDDGVSFRSVAAAGPEVWAGGSQGALFHSLDGGSRWERITVSDSNGKLTGTIRSIDAKDSGRLKVTTSSGESWLSVDGGRHWTRM
jgi:hypothetical protein